MRILSKILRADDIGGQLSFMCPGCKEVHIVKHGDGAGPRWGWNGDVEKPTFAPSILVRGKTLTDKGMINTTEESIKELTAKPLEEISPEIAAQMKETQEEYEKLRLTLTSLLSVNEANGFNKDEINKASDEFETISLKKQSVWNKLIELDRQKYVEKENRIKELKDSIAPIGQKIIDTLLDSSKVTQEQADSWANSQVIEKSAITRLKKIGYAVVFTTMSGSFVDPDDNKSRFMPNSAPVHGDERFLKAFMRMASMRADSVYTVLYHIVGSESRIVEEANKLSSEHSNHDE